MVEPIPDGPTIRTMQELAKKHGMVIVVPIYEEEITGVYYNTAAVIDADGTYLGKYRKHHIPHVGPGFWEKFYFRPGNLGYPVFNTAAGKVGVYICYDRHFPEGARDSRAERRGDRVQPVGDGRRPVGVSLEARAAGARGRQRLLRRRRSTASASRRRGTSASSTARATSAIRADRSWSVASRDKDELVVADLDLEMIQQVRNTWQFYRDRRPETYGAITAM